MFSLLFSKLPVVVTSHCSVALRLFIFDDNYLDDNLSIAPCVCVHMFKSSEDQLSMKLELQLGPSFHGVVFSPMSRLLTIYLIGTFTFRLFFFFFFPRSCFC